MTLFLRNDRNETIVDIELNEGENGLDLRSVVIIETYSELLLKNLNISDEVISDFSELSELRGWFWEVFMEMSDKPTFIDARKQVKTILTTIAKKYNLAYIED